MVRVDYYSGDIPSRAKKGVNVRTLPEESNLNYGPHPTRKNEYATG